MEKVIFTDPDTKEKIEFYVLEETQINGKNALSDAIFLLEVLGL